MTAGIANGNTYVGLIDVNGAFIICGSIYSSVVNAGFKRATGAEGTDSHRSEYKNGFQK